MYKSEITLDINGEKRTAYVRHADTLLAVLREKFGLTGAKPGCLHGDCGTCTIGIDGKPIKACLMLAIEAVGKKITTVEGLNNAPIQQTFVDEFAFQCGYCTPGFIMKSHLLIETHPDANESVIKEWLESNICRCTGYKEIEQAVKAALFKKQT
ncbi:(2Fe-2S)-binding protein [Desulfuribacillus alkaliarsenatis]|uniref:(2Fe-2S)-binding protein n=1 Tax=Desulfuribacillus alkaliarsenatis TaxID=766136 RepID=A0A1E5G0J0_9FIRM|nr:(2Fe-2S)-binding protein [Desulfuribacillus alkaliarsenatis]OEF96300.1 (2Fe-2S)-binding protein [Desulfuribacillus alkaliarsenatis]